MNTMDLKEDLIMKKIVSILLALVMLVGAGMSALAEGSVSTDGSTSMQKVIGALEEIFL